MRTKGPVLWHNSRLWLQFKFSLFFSVRTIGWTHSTDCQTLFPLQLAQVAIRSSGKIDLFEKNVLYFSIINRKRVFQYPGTLAWLMERLKKPKNYWKTQFVQLKSVWQSFNNKTLVTRSLFIDQVIVSWEGTFEEYLPFFYKSVSKILSPYFMQ